MLRVGRREAPTKTTTLSRAGQPRAAPGGHRRQERNLGAHGIRGVEDCQPVQRLQETRRSERDAALWQRRYVEATRQLHELRADPLTAFRDEFRAGADRRVDTWLSSSDDADQHRIP